MWVGMRDSWVVGAAAGGRFLRVRAGGRTVGYREGRPRPQD